MLPSLLIYIGLLITIIGGLSLIKPWRVLRIRSRRAGAVVGGAGLLLVVIGFALPTSEKRASGAEAELDRLMPIWHFSEKHSKRVAAPPAAVFAAIQAVRANEILLFRTLTTIRRFGRPGPESILNAPEHLPILEVATRTTFIRLAEQPPHELVVGTVVAAPPDFEREHLSPKIFGRPVPPGFAIAAMDFVVRADPGGGSLVSTETRVFASDKATRRSFSRYWRLILPGSDIIRRMWLRAIKRRAELARAEAGARAGARARRFDLEAGFTRRIV